MVKVVAMLLPTMRAIASQKSRKILKKRLCMRWEPALSIPHGRGSRGQAPSQGIARAADVFYFRILAGFEIELAAQIADMRVDAAIVRRKLSAEGLFGHRFARNHLAGGTHQQF